MKEKGPLEKIVQREAVKIFKQLGFLVVRHTPIRITGKGFFVKVPDDEVGMPDLFILAPHNAANAFKGRFIGVEIKRLSTYQSSHQKMRESEIKERGGFYFVVASTDDAIKVANQILGRTATLL